MRHRKSGRKLGRSSAHRRALWRNMVTSLLEHGRIKTTLAKAKELRSHVERTITRGIKLQPLLKKAKSKRTVQEQARIVHTMRMAGRMVRTRDVLAKLFNDIAPKLKDRPGGYTRIVKTAPRVGDASPMAIVELILPE